MAKFKKGDIVAVNSKEDYPKVHGLFGEVRKNMFDHMKKTIVVDFFVESDSFEFDELFKHSHLSRNMYRFYRFFGNKGIRITCAPEILRHATKEEKALINLKQ